MRCKFFAFIILIFSSCISLFSLSKKSDSNILLVTIDTLRADYLSCYGGSRVQTPNIDRLASEGVLFAKAFAHNVVTLPSHVNILTGTYPTYHGVRDNAGFRLSEDALLISEILKQEGYNTAAVIGAFPLDDRFGLDQGFDLYDDFYGDTAHSHDMFFVERPADKVVDIALEWVNKQGDSPWFCWVHLFDPHSPYDPPEVFKEKYPDDHYGGEAAFVDQQLGRLFDALGGGAVIDEPVIIITSDHGESLGEHGELTHGVFAYNSTLHIPFIIHQSRFFAEAKIIRETVGHIDILPTILDILDLKIPEVVQGRSLLPLIENPSRWKPADCYFESLSPNLNRNWAPLHGFMRRNLKYISLPVPELYDLDKDFSEKKNLAEDEIPIIKELKHDLDTFIGKVEHTLSERKPIDRETKNRLRSLGYISGTADSSRKKVYSVEDDPKNLIDLDRKMQDGSMAFQRADVERAIELFEDILRERPDYGVIYDNLSHIYRESGQVGRSIQLLEKAAELGVADASLMSKLAIYYQEAGRLEEAKTLLEGLVRAVPDDVEILNYLGVSYWKLGNYERAEEVFQKAITLDRGYSRLYSNLASVHLSQKDFPQAEKRLKEALSYDPDLASAHNGMGVVLGARNELTEAANHWEKAVELDKTQFDALYNLCIALVKLNRFQKAKEYTERFIASAPAERYAADIEEMKKILARLKEAIKK